MTVHRPKTACDLCGKLVARMREHMESMHQAESEMSYRCDLCGKGFPNSQKLRDHNMNVHLKLRPYTCRLIFQIYRTSALFIFPADILQHFCAVFKPHKKQHKIVHMQLCICKMVRILFKNITGPEAWLWIELK